MTGLSLGLRTASYGSLEQQSKNGVVHIRAAPILVRKSSKHLLPSSREKEKCRNCIFRYFGLRKVPMLLLIAVALLVFVFGTFTGGNKAFTISQWCFLSDSGPESSNMIIIQHVEDLMPFDKWTPSSSGTVMRRGDTVSGNQFQRHPHHHHLPLETASRIVHGNVLPSVHHPCEKFAFPPPPANPKRIGPRPCPVCYLPIEEAAASMPNLPSASPVIHNLTYVLD